jgi:hypothetical protein
MIAHAPTKDTRRTRSRSLRAHAIGLVGANLAIGALFAWVLPLLVRLWRRSPTEGELSLVQLFAPWADSEGGVTALALLYDVLMLSAVVAVIVLVIHAARRLDGKSEA